MGSREKAAPELEYERIDCGSDGIAELLTTMTMGSMRLYMIIKDIDGELVICYAEGTSICYNFRWFCLRNNYGYEGE